MKRACAYIRVSREKEDGVSPEQQREKAELQARLMGADLIRVYEDLDISGRSDKRPAFQEMVSDIKAGKYDMVMVYKIDRFARNVKDFHHYLQVLDQNNCSLVSISQNFDTGSPSGRLLRNILVDFAQFESEMISERVRDNKAANAKRGRWNGGHAPFGYQVVEKRLMIHEEEAKAVRRMFELAGAGQGCLAIAKEITALGVKPKRGSVWGKYWSEYSIKHILQNKVYLGEVVYGDVTAHGDHEAIVDQELFEAVQKLLKRRAGIPSRAQASDHLLTGLLYCPHCGHHSFQIQYNGKKRTRRYQCYTKKRQSTVACPSKLLDAATLEAKIVEVLFNIAYDSNILDEAAAAAKEIAATQAEPYEQERPALEKELKRVRGLMKELFSDYYDHRIITREQFQIKNLEYLDAEKIILDRLATIAQVSTSYQMVEENINLLKTELFNLRANWGFQTPQEKRMALRSVINKIIVHSDFLEIDFFIAKQKVVPSLLTSTTMVF
ncbi:MAG: recombinase family protein [Bacillota bacterium]